MRERKDRNRNIGRQRETNTEKGQREEEQIDKVKGSKRIQTIEYLMFIFIDEGIIM